MILQLNPSIPVNTPKGPGEAILIIDYGKEDDLLFTVFLDETGQCWTFNNKEIRAIKNISIGREKVEDPKVSKEEYSIYGDPGGHMATAVKQISEDLKERNKFIHTPHGAMKILSDPNLKEGEYYFINETISGMPANVFTKSKDGMIISNGQVYNPKLKTHVIGNRVFSNPFWGYGEE